MIDVIDGCSARPRRNTPTKERMLERRSVHIYIYMCANPQPLPSPPSAPPPPPPFEVEMAEANGPDECHVWLEADIL